MAVTDFLFQGTPPPSIDNFSSTSANLPDWWQSYLKAQVAKASAIAGEPFQGYTGPRLAPLTADQTGAFDLARGNLGITDPAFANAEGALTTARNLSPTGAADPYLADASRTFPEAADEYMNPYMTGVVDRIAELGNRNLMEKILPSVQDSFIAAGQPGSARSEEFTARAIRDTQNEILGQQAGALATGYGQAAQTFGADASRFGALGATAGNLAGGEMAGLGNLATTTGALGTARQKAGLTDVATQEAVGQTLQAENQKNLDLAYQTFLEERDYPRKNIAFLNEALRGQAPPASTTTTGTAPATVLNPSPLAAIAGTGSLIGALAGLGKRRGGSIRRGAPVLRGRYARGGALGYAHG